MTRGAGVAVAAAVLVAALGALELALGLGMGGAHFSPRVFADRPAPLLYGLSPDARESVYLFGRTVTILTDTTGHRSAPALNAAAPARANHRLHIVGDSMVFGWGLEGAETIPGQLQHTLGSDWQVISHGVPGYGPFEYAEVIKQIPPDEPVVVVFTEENDLWDAYRVYRTAGTNCGFLATAPARESALRCAVLSARAVQFVLEAAKTLSSLGLRPTPLGAAPDNGVAAKVLAHRVEALFAPIASARASHITFGVIPWKGAISPAGRHEYFPPPPQWRASGLLRDDLGLVATFQQLGEAARDGLYIEGDSHLSAKGASLVAAGIVQHALSKW